MCGVTRLRMPRCHYIILRLCFFSIVTLNLDFVSVTGAVIVVFLMALVDIVSRRDRQPESRGQMWRGWTTGVKEIKRFHSSEKS